MVARAQDLLTDSLQIADAPIVIIGTGPVGIQMARRLRQELPAQTLLVYGDEPWLPYNRVRLSSLLAGEVMAEDLFDAGDLLDDEKVEFRYNQRIAAIDTGKRLVEGIDGHRQAYRQLILATGSSPHVPGIPGINLPGVYTFRDMNDANLLAARRVRSRHTVVLGGGLLGIETARAMQRSHTEVSIIEHSPRLMPRQLNEAASQMLQDTLGELGINCILFDAVREITGDEHGVTGITLHSGREIPCDTIVVSAGIRPNIALARNAGLRVGRGIRVNEHMRTSDPRVYAVGECSEYKGNVYGLVGPGLEQAAVAARNLGGGRAVYRGTIASTRLKVLHMPVFSSGDISDDYRRPSDRLVEFRDPDQGIYRALLIRRNRLQACVALGEFPESGRIHDAVVNKRRIWYWQVRRFAETGRLWPQQDAADVGNWPDRAVVCNCTGVDCGALRAALPSCRNVQELSTSTGAASVCGSCRPLLAQMFGRSEEFRLPGKNLLLGSSLLAALLAMLFTFAGPVPWSESVQGFTPDTLWRDGFWKQVSGYSLLTIAALISLVSLRKRLPRLRLGDFAWWRAVHAVAGTLLLLILALHTGLNLGDSLNLALISCFLLLIVLGGLAGLAAALESTIGPALAKRLRGLLNTAHLLALWPLPVLLAGHIVSVYYF